MGAPVHVYQPGSWGRPPRVLTTYGDDLAGTDVLPVRVLFYGQHYDALVEERDRREIGG